MLCEAKCCALEEPVRLIPLTGLIDPGDRSDQSSGEKSDSAIIHSKNDNDEVYDWRKPLINYLQGLSNSVDRKV
jgi:hypothetical protein